MQGHQATLDASAGQLAVQLLRAAATLCLRNDDGLTCYFMRMLDLLGGLLTLPQTVEVLQRLYDTGAPLHTTPVLRLVQRLVDVLRRDGQLLLEPSSTRRSATTLSYAQVIQCLSILSKIHRTVARQDSQQRGEGRGETQVWQLQQQLQAVPYGLLLHTLTLPSQFKRRRYSIGECGILIEIVAHLDAETLRKGGCTTVQLEAVQLLPRACAAYVLQALQLPFDTHEIPLLLRGYAALSDAALQAQMLRVLIARTLRAVSTFSPEEVVICVEAYSVAGLYPPHLFGVLLARVADVKQRFSLDHSIRLLRCAAASRIGNIQTVCTTAVQPVFQAQVRLLLQSDPQMLVAVASTAITILHCLRDAFPHADISAAVLANIARYHLQASPAVTMAALELVEARGSVDYDVLQVLADHCIQQILPLSDAGELASVFLLLVSCGLRSKALLEAAYHRMNAVVDTASGAALALFATALLKASVELDSHTSQLVLSRIRAITAAQVLNADVDGDGKDDGTAAGPGTDKAAARRRRGRAAKAATATTTATTTTTAAVSIPLTFSQAAMLLQLIRGVGSRATPSAIGTADAVLSYLSHRVSLALLEENAALESSGSGSDGTHDSEKMLSIDDLDDDDGGNSSSRGRTSSSTPVQPLPLLRNVPATEVDSVLRCCIDLSSQPKKYELLFQQLANYVEYLLTECSDEVGNASPATADRQPAAARPSSGIKNAPTSALWSGDLILSVELCSLFIRLGQSKHPVVQQLFHEQYEQRRVLLQRALLLKTVRQSLLLAGSDAHPQLFHVVASDSAL